MIRIGVIGYGYWGPNIVRNFMTLNNVEVNVVADLNAEALKKVQGLYPSVHTTQDHSEVLSNPDIDAVAIVTPVSSHYPLAKEALEQGKHIFIEKPFTASVKEAEELIAIAKKNKCLIMVDHTFIFTGAVQKIKELVDQGELGDLQYYDSKRVALGLFQHDVNVIWDLAPHDFSIVDYVIDNKPIALSAHGVDHLNRGIENIAYITIYYDNNLLVHINVNWMSPMKMRSTVVGGNKKMLVWDDLQTDEKIKIYDKGVEVNNKEGIYQLKVDYRSGDMYSPRIDHTEALRAELEYFVDCIENNKTPINDGESGLRIVRMLEMADESLKAQGKVIQFS